MDEGKRGTRPIYAAVGELKLSIAAEVGVRLPTLGRGIRICVDGEGLAWAGKGGAGWRLRRRAGGKGGCDGQQR